MTHFITAFVVLFLIFGVIGTPDEGRPTPVVGDIAEEVDGKPAPAPAAGLREGDRVIEIDNRRVDDWVDVRDGIRSNPGETVSLLIQRGNDRRDIEIEPLAVDDAGEEIGVIGVLPRPEFPGRVHRDGPITSVNRSATIIKQLLVGGSAEDGTRIDGFFQALPRAFSPRNLGITGDGPTNERPISVIGAGRVAVDFAAEGQVVAFLFLFAQLNIFVAVFNMLPLPPLDGGHLLILGIGKLRGRPVDPKTVMPVMAIVFSLLVVLGVLLIYYDIFSPVQVP